MEKKDKLGTLVFMGSIIHEILIWKHIQTERVDDYKYLLIKLLNLGYTILSATVDSKRGVFESSGTRKIIQYKCVIFIRNVLFKDI